MSMAHALASSMGGMRTAGDLVARMQMTRKMRLPVTEKLREEVLTLPLFPGMTEPEVDAVAGAIHRFFEE